MSMQRKDKPDSREGRRIRAVREHFQREKPTLDQLLASGDYAGPIQARDAWPVDRLLSRLKHMREKQGLSQRQLAKKIAMDVTALSWLERGRQANVTMQTLERLAGGLGYTLQVQMKPMRGSTAA